MLELFAIPWGVPRAFPFQPRWTGVFCGAKVPPAVLCRASKGTRCFPAGCWGRVMRGGQGELGSCDCLKSSNSLQLSGWRFYVTPRAAPQAWICRFLVFFVFCFSFSVQGYFQPVLTRCLQQGRKHLQRWAGRWYFNLSKPDEESSPGQSIWSIWSFEKETFFLPDLGPGWHVQHFVKLIAYRTGSGVERSCRWCVLAEPARSKAGFGSSFARAAC